MNDKKSMAKFQALIVQFHNFRYSIIFFMYKSGLEGKKKNNSLPSHLTSSRIIAKSAQPLLTLALFITAPQKREFHSHAAQENSKQEIFSFSSIALCDENSRSWCQNYWWVATLYGRRYFVAAASHTFFSCCPICFFRNPEIFQAPIFIL